MDIMADLIVNHVSSRSPQFEDFRKRGEESAYAGMFLDSTTAYFQTARGKSDLLKIYRPRPGLPFTKLQLANGPSACSGPRSRQSRSILTFGDPAAQTLLDSRSWSNFRRLEFERSGWTRPVTRSRSPEPVAS